MPTLTVAETPLGDLYGAQCYFEHIPGNGMAIRLRKAFSSVAKHSDSRLLIALSVAGSSGSFCAFSSRRPIFSRARLSVERMIAKSSRFPIMRVSGALAEFAMPRASPKAFLAGSVRLSVPLKLPVAKSALRPVLANAALRLGFSEFVLFGAWATAEATSATRTIVILMYFIHEVPQRGM